MIFTTLDKNTIYVLNHVLKAVCKDKDRPALGKVHVTNDILANNKMTFEATNGFVYTRAIITGYDLEDSNNFPPSGLYKIDVRSKGLVSWDLDEINVFPDVGFLQFSKPNIPVLQNNYKYFSLLTNFNPEYMEIVLPTFIKVVSMCINDKMILVKASETIYPKPLDVDIYSVLMPMASYVKEPLFGKDGKVDPVFIKEYATVWYEFENENSCEKESELQLTES